MSGRSRVSRSTSLKRIHSREVNLKPKFPDFKNLALKVMKSYNNPKDKTVISPIQNLGLTHFPSAIFDMMKKEKVLEDP